LYKFTHITYTETTLSELLRENKINNELAIREVDDHRYKNE